MNCPSTQDLLECLNGSNTELLGSENERHLATCVACRDRLEALNQVRGVLSEHFSSTAPRSRADCPDHPALADFVEGKAESSAQGEVAEHLEQCEACAYWVARLRHWLDAPDETFPETPQKLKTRAIEMASPAPRPSWLRSHYAFVGVAVLVSVLVLVLFYWQGWLHAPGSSPEHATNSSSQNAQNIPAQQPVGASFNNPLDIVFRSRVNGSAEVHESGVPFQSQPTLTKHDDYGFRVRLNRDGWLYVFQLDSRAQLAQLFPKAEYGTITNPLKGGQDYLLPADGKWYYLDETAGTETVFVACSEKQAEPWEELSRRNQLSGDQDAAEQLIAQLNRLASAGSDGNQAVVMFQFQHR